MLLSKFDNIPLSLTVTEEYVYFYLVYPVSSDVTYTLAQLVLPRHNYVTQKFGAAHVYKHRGVKYVYGYKKERSNLTKEELGYRSFLISNNTTVWRYDI